MQQSPQNNVSQHPFIGVQDEQILVVKRATLFLQTAWHGIQNQSIDTYITIIKNQGEYISRAHAETDPTYKQIIPYLIFTHQKRYFLMQRKSSASEQRLRNKLTLGIGGHVNQEDMQGATLFDWARREFHEEVEYQGNLRIETIGLLNDDSNEVGRVHLGLVMVLHGDSDQIRVKSELKNGNLQTVEECLAQIEVMESWSRIAFDHLQRSSIV